MFDKCCRKHHIRHYDSCIVGRTHMFMHLTTKRFMWRGKTSIIFGPTFDNYVGEYQNALFREVRNTLFVFYRCLKLETFAFPILIF